MTSRFHNSREIIRRIIASNSELTRNEIFKKFVLELPIGIRKEGLAEELTEKYSLICEDKITLAPEIPYAKNILEKLKELKKSIFLSSATPLMHLYKILELRELSKYFDGIYGAPSSKNNHIRQILSITNNKLNKTVYIGDSELDRMAAENSGCNFIGIDSGGNRFKHKPKILIRDFKSLFKYITVS